MDSDADDRSSTGSQASDLSDWQSEDEAPTLQMPDFKSAAEAKEWTRKQRAREYRVAARREKRTRKADEKKQRKLNAMILRRMTKNPEKYNKNIERNRQRDVIVERQRIRKEAVSQVERLAAVHDPSGKTFNVGPVVVQEDGKVVSVETLERRAKARAEREAKNQQEAEKATTATGAAAKDNQSAQPDISQSTESQNGINPARMQLIQENRLSQDKKPSKTQEKKLSRFEELPPPPKPVLPVGIELPKGEEDWLSLWDLSDAQIERRILTEKRRKVNERKALRAKQKAGKVERRAARDERRKVYREKKLEWKAIKEVEKKRKEALLRVEQEEGKRIEIEVNRTTRQRIMDVCAELGFTVDNIAEAKEVKPRALGMKGQEVDFDVIEAGDKPAMLVNKETGTYLRDITSAKPQARGRVDLAKAAKEANVKQIHMSEDAVPGGLNSDFVSFDIGDNVKIDYTPFEGLSYNHKLRRKLHRAIEAAQIKKETIVRSKAVEHCEQNGLEIPTELAKEYKPMKLGGRRILEDGTVETEKQERVRKRLELAEYNKAAKVLRQQAKAIAIEAGLRKYAELTGQAMPKDGDSEMIDAVFSDAAVENSSKIEKMSKKRNREEDARMGEQENVAKKSKKVKDVGRLSGITITQPNGAMESAVVEPHIEGDRLQGTLGNARAVSETREDERKLKKSEAVDMEDSKNEEAARTERRRLKKEKKLAENVNSDTVESEPLDVEHSTKKAKKSKSKSGHEHEAADEVPSSVQKKSKKDLQANGAEQWNPDALGGDDARKEKFLRLLGAGKANGIKENGNSKKNVKDFSDVSRVEDELERQYDAGIRMKHDGGGKRRGLGA